MRKLSKKLNTLYFTLEMSFVFGLKMNKESQKIRKLLKRKVSKTKNTILKNTKHNIRNTILKWRIYLYIKVSSSQSFKELSFSCDRKPLKGIPENSIVVSFRTFSEKRLWMSKL